MKASSNVSVLLTLCYILSLAISSAGTKVKVSEVEKAQMDATFAQMSLGISYFLALKGTLEGEQREDLYNSLYDLYKTVSSSSA